jgi:hypothetical protein
MERLGLGGLVVGGGEYDGAIGGSGIKVRADRVPCHWFIRNAGTTRKNRRDGPGAAKGLPITPPASSTCVILEVGIFMSLVSSIWLLGYEMSLTLYGGHIELWDL